MGDRTVTGTRLGGGGYQAGSVGSQSSGSHSVPAAANVCDPNTDFLTLLGIAFLPSDVPDPQPLLLSSR